MLNVFVSCQRVDNEPAAVLIDRLRSARFSVEHSPRNPMDGCDERWAGWYETGLPAALNAANVFICVIDAVWASSTWMAIEADEALKRLRSGRLRRMFYYNPERNSVTAAGMQPYLLEALPHDFNEALPVLANCEDAT